MSIIGQYKGIDINSGTDAEIQAQIKAIDKKSSSSSSSSSSGTYGKSKSSASESVAKISEQNAISTASSYVSSSFLNSIASNNDLVAFYINALAYGDYTIGDVVNDIKRREMASKGDTAMSNLTIIDPNKDRTTYQKTDPEGIKSVTTTQKKISTAGLQGLIDTNTLKYGNNVPDEVFDISSPLLDPTSDEFKKAVSEVKSAYYDVLNQQLSASTEQQKAVADYAAEKFKQDLETKYGIILSDDATKAYNQIQNIENTYGQRGIQNSGMKNEEVDKTLKQTRLTDQRQRQEKLSQEEYSQGSTLMASGTPAQIQQTIDEDKAKGLPQSEWRATKWGLIPDSSVAENFSLSALREKFPDATDEEIQGYHDSVLDENGNYRSSLYANYYGQLNTNKQNEKTAAENKVTTMAQNAAEKAMEKQTPTGVLAVQGGTGTSNGIPASSASAIKDSVDNIKDNLNNTNTTTSTKSSTSSNNNGYSGSSIVDYLKSTGGSSDYSSRAALAAKNGITGYTGTASQNTQLLSKLRGY